MITLLLIVVKRVNFVSAIFKLKITLVKIKIYLANYNTNIIRESKLNERGKTFREEAISSHKYPTELEKFCETDLTRLADKDET